MTSKENIFETIIEKYRFWIGGILILAIVGGSAVLLWRENYRLPSYDDRISELEEKISLLENDQKISNSKFLISNQNSNEQISNVQTEQEQGVVAGANINSAISRSNNSSAVKPISGKININTATEEQLISLPEIGPATAKKIIDYRTQKGSFKIIDELDNVSGIGKKTIDKIRELVTVN